MRRHLIICSAAGLLFLSAVLGRTSEKDITPKVHPPLKMMTAANKQTDSPSAISHRITIFMSGDVMTGRGIDQVLPHPGDPTLQWK